MWPFRHRVRRPDTGSSDPAPVPPVNVRVRWSDGTTVAVECLYLGRVATIDRWEAVTPVIVRAGQRAEVLADVLPPRSEVRIRWVWG